MNYQHICTAAAPTLTYAIKGLRALEAAGIYAYTVKLEAGRTRRGCSYGIAFYCGDADAVKRTLRAAGVKIRQYLEGGGEPV